MNFVKMLSTGTQIDIHDDLTRYKTLSKDDLSSSKWMFAPYLVSTNMERLQISYHQASKFAKRHNTFLYRWPLHLHKWKNRPLLNSHRQTVSQHPVFWQYFVPGAPAYLTNNLNTSLGLANGTKVELHSLTFSSQIIGEYIADRYLSQPPGTVITLTGDLIPASVNIKLDKHLWSTPHKLACHDKITKFSLSETETVIPLLLNKGISSTRKWYTAPGNHPAYGPSRIRTSLLFAFDLAFALTVHKAQGQTLDSVILCLSQRPTRVQQIVFSAVYVEFLRVKFLDNINFDY